MAMIYKKSFILLDPLGLADFLIPSEAITSNTTQHHSCELSLARLDSAPQNKTRLPGYCPIEDGYIEIDLQSSKIITAIGIQVCAAIIIHTSSVLTGNATEII